MFYTGFCRSVLFAFVCVRSVAMRGGKVCDQLQQLGEGRQRVGREGKEPDKYNNNNAQQQRQETKPSN